MKIFTTIKFAELIFHFYKQYIKYPKRIGSVYGKKTTKLHPSPQLLYIKKTKYI